MAYAWILLALVAAAAAQNNYITVTPTSAIIDESHTVTLEFRLSNPIICEDPHAYCAVVVYLTNKNPRDITTSACHVEWTRDEWQAVKTITVQAVANFVDDGEKTFGLITEPAQSAAEFYNNFNAPDITITTRSRPAGHCSSITDPHIFTFDGGDYIDLTAGTYLLWQAPMRNFEVHTRVTEGRNCGMAARDGCDTLWIDRCSGSPVIRSDFKSTDGKFPSIERLDGGSTYLVTFPRSGATLRVSFQSRVFHVGQQQCGWSGCFIVYVPRTSYWIDVFATAPGADWGYQANGQPRTSGLCGSFDNKRSNDPATAAAYAIASGQSLFEKVPACVATPAPKVDYSRCTFVPPAVQKPIVTYPDSEMVTDLIKQYAIPHDDPRVNYVFDAQPSTIPSFTAEEQARAEAYCIKAIEESLVAIACRNFGVDLRRFISTCTNDILLQNDYSLIDGSVDAMKQVCQFHVLTNVTLFDIAADGSLVVSESQKTITDAAVCPNECSFHGTCVQGVCNCDNGWLGNDCFTPVGALPVLSKLIPNQCDARSATPCPDSITLIGDRFLADTVQCKVDGVISEVVYLGGQQILCKLPAGVKNNGATDKVVDVTFSNDGEKWAPVLKFTWFDSACRSCNEGGVCTDKPSSCKIANQCYVPNDPSATNACLTCQPTRTTTAFTYTYTNAALCGPIFAQTSYLVSLTEDTPVNGAVATVSSTNNLVAADSTNKYTYSLTGASAGFAINANTGAITTTATLNYEAKKSFTFNAVAVDKAGNSASTTVLITVLDVDEAPVFPVNSYSYTMAENSPAQILGTITATDPDTNDSKLDWNVITYSLKSFQFVTFANMFSVNPTTGVLSTTGPLDFEKRSVYTFQLEARDAGGLASTTQITLTLTDVNETPTFIQLSQSDVPENSPPNTVIATLTTDDEDLNQQYTYTLLDNAGGRVKLTTSNGVTKLVVADVPLNYEELRFFTISIKSADNGSPSLSVTSSAQILITNVNDKPTLITLASIPAATTTTTSPSTTMKDSYSSTTAAPVIPLVALPEDTKLGPIGILATADEDSDQTFTYTLVSNPGGLFSIVDNQLILVKSLDYETAHSQTFTIVSTDSGYPQLSTDVFTFTIRVDDANDPPRNVAFTSTVTLPENTATNIVVGTLSGLDQDPNQPFTYRIDDANSKFTVSTTSCNQVSEGTRCTATITLKSALDFETNPTETLVISAVSSGVSYPFNVPVPVSDVNEPPTGVELTTSSITENCADDTVVGSVIVHDPDAGETLSVELVDDASGRFYLKSNSARASDAHTTSYQLLVKSGALIDFETSPSYTLKFYVADRAFLSGVFAVTVAVNDEPVVVHLTGNTVAENSEAGTTVGSIAVSGLDRPALTPHLSFTSSADGAFKLSDSSMTPKLLVNDPTLLDFENFATINLNFQVSFDGPANQLIASASTPIAVTVIDVNEKPTISSDLSIIKVHDDTLPGTQVRTLTASDVDAGDSVTFTIVSGNNFNIFAIDSKTGALSVAITPDSSGVQMNRNANPLVVRVTDKAGLYTQYSIPVQVYDDCLNPVCGQGKCVDKRNSYTCQIQQAEASSSSSASSGAIAGGVIAGIVALVLIILVVVIIMRRRQNNRPVAVAPIGIADVLYDDVDVDTKVAGVGAPSGYSALGTVVHTDVFIPGASNPLYSWYQPEASKDDCNEQLIGAPVGTFIVRDFTPTPGWHMLHLRTQRDILSEKIKRTPEGEYALAGENVRARSRLPTFSDLPHLVRYYAAPEQADLPVSLAVDNPIYDNNALINRGAPRQIASLGYEGARPTLPLRENERASVAAFNDDSDDNLYVNKQEARAAFNERDRMNSVASVQRDRMHSVASVQRRQSMDDVMV